VIRINRLHAADPRLQSVSLFSADCGWQKNSTSHVTVRVNNDTSTQVCSRPPNANYLQPQMFVGRFSKKNNSVNCRGLFFFFVNSKTLPRNDKNEKSDDSEWHDDTNTRFIDNSNDTSPGERKIKKNIM